MSDPMANRERADMEVQLCMGSPSDGAFPTLLVERVEEERQPSSGHNQQVELVPRVGQQCVVRVCEDAHRHGTCAQLGSEDDGAPVLEGDDGGGRQVEQGVGGAVGNG